MKKNILILAVIVNVLLLSCNPNKEDNYIIDGHEYVDLGLPSGLLWATCNIGADRPEDVGGYFAWGETSPKEEYTEENCLTYGKDMDDISGNAGYDAATANWGGRWRMPTLDEAEELVDYCNFQIVKKDGVLGAKLTGPNGNKIFLPFTGYRLRSEIYYEDEESYLWCSTPATSCSDPRRCAETLYLDKEEIGCWSHCEDYYGRGAGHPIRPVVYVTPTW